MNMRHMGKTAALFATGLCYWFVIAIADHVAEPWDSARYWPLWYPLSLLLSAVSGAWLARRGWVAGAMIVLPQLILVMVRAEEWSLLPVGVAFVLALTLPAMLIAQIAARLRQRSR